MSRVMAPSISTPLSNNALCMTWQNSATGGHADGKSIQSRHTSRIGSNKMCAACMQFILPYITFRRWPLAQLYNAINLAGMIQHLVCFANESGRCEAFLLLARSLYPEFRRGIPGPMSTRHRHPALSLHAWASGPHWPDVLVSPSADSKLACKTPQSLEDRPSRAQIYGPRISKRHCEPLDIEA